MVFSALTKAELVQPPFSYITNITLTTSCREIKIRTHLTHRQELKAFEL